MKFNDNSKLAGKHAFLSASKGSWVNYSDEKLDIVFSSSLAAQRGTALHDLANQCIKLGQPLPDNGTTMSLYVNDCIGFRMKSEVTLFYSLNAFGTCDAISFRKMKLRISDLKTGSLKTGERQLEIYAAYFCLEYQMSPFEIEIELRIYQNDEVREYAADPVDISMIMEKIKSADRRLTELREEAE